MLYVHTKNTETTTEITIRNRLYYLLVLDSISQEETNRLWEEFDRALIEACPKKEHKDLINMSIHYLWWEKSMVGTVFITSDIMNVSEDIGFDAKSVLTEQEQKEVNIPYCSIYCDIFDDLSSSESSNIPSRIVTTLDDENMAVTVSMNNGDPILRCGFMKKK